MNQRFVRSHFWELQRWSVGAIGSLGWAFDGERLKIKFIGKSLLQVRSSARTRREELQA